MNRRIQTAFENINAAVARHKSEINSILSGYKSDKESKKRQFSVYADPEKYFSEWQNRTIPLVRSQIVDSRKQLHDSILKETIVLRDELANMLLNVPSDAFMKQLQLFQTAKMQPSKPEVEAMLKLNEASLIGIRALNMLLAESKSTIRISAQNPDQLSKDISDLERIGAGPVYFPLDYHKESVELWSDTERDPRFPGYLWDSAALVSASAFFDAFVRKMPEFEAHWENVVPSVTQVADADIYPDRETARDDYLSDRQNAIESAAEVFEDPAAAALYRTELQAKDRAAYDAVMEHYL